jgi:phage repressor protein C with HTH and peptisase S24 domain
MAWADRYIAELERGRVVRFRPRGDSMHPRIRSGQLVEVSPASRSPGPDDIVLCTVHGLQYLHIVKAAKQGRFLIGNNRGGLNGWTTRIHGVLTAVLD